MKSIITKEEDGTIKLTITIPKEDIKKTEENVVADTAKQAQVAGFRKGKAPKKLVEEQINKEKVKEEVLKTLLPKYYISAVTKNNIKPIINPKIHIEKLEENTDWEFIAFTCETPTIDLKDYKKNIQNLTAKSKIIIPGKEQQPPKFDEIVGALLNSISVTIPHILIEQEVEKLLAQTLDEIKKLGLSLDQYLASTKKTPEMLRADYEKRAESDIKLEFALHKIAEEEKITVEEKEINEALAQAKSNEERTQMEANKYLLASILRQQKTLDFLKNL